MAGSTFNVPVVATAAATAHGDLIARMAALATPPG